MVHKYAHAKGLQAQCIMDMIHHRCTIKSFIIKLKSQSTSSLHCPSRKETKFRHLFLLQMWLSELLIYWQCFKILLLKITIIPAFHSKLMLSHKSLCTFCSSLDAFSTSLVPLTICSNNYTNFWRRKMRLLSFKFVVDSYPPCLAWRFL